MAPQAPGGNHLPLFRFAAGCFYGAQSVRKHGIDVPADRRKFDIFVEDLSRVLR